MMQASLHSSGLAVSATANDIIYRTDVFELNPNDCAINPSLGKKLVASTSAHLTDPPTATVRIFVQSNKGTEAIPDGALYDCLVHIATSALPGTYRFTSNSLQAFGSNGAPYPHVQGRSADVTVSLVQTCASDCNMDGEVTIDEIITAINLALGAADVAPCFAADINRDGEITIDELVAGTNSALLGCAAP